MNTEQTIDRLRGQLQNCVNHLERSKDRGHRKEADRIDACIESANKCLYETLVEQPAEQELTCRWRRLYGCDTPKNHVLYTDGHGEDHEFYQRRPETCGDCGGKIVEGE